MSGTAGQAVVYGSSGFAEGALFWWQESARAAGSEPEVLGFIDDDETVNGEQRGDYAVLGGRAWLSDRAQREQLTVLLAIADPADKRRIVAELRPLGVRFASVIHPSVIRPAGVPIGEGSIVAPNSSISVGVTVGDFVLVNMNCTLGHECSLGDYATALPGVNVSGRTAIGAGVLLGTGSCVLQGLEIGDGATVGAGAAVLADVAAGVTVAGVPARELAS